MALVKMNMVYLYLFQAFRSNCTAVVVEVQAHEVRLEDVANVFHLVTSLSDGKGQSVCNAVDTYYLCIVLLKLCGNTTSISCRGNKINCLLLLADT